MKLLASALIVAAVLVMSRGCTHATGTSSAPLPLHHSLSVTVTAYAVGDGLTPGVLAADGRPVWPGTAAVSPDLKPLLWGKTVWLYGWPYKVRDLMWSGWTRRIDLFLPSIAAARAWGVRHTVVTW